MKFLGHPQEHGHDESHDDNPVVLVLVRLAFNLQFNLIDLEREDKKEHAPRDEQHKQRERHHDGAPLRESDAGDWLECRAESLVGGGELPVDGLDERRLVEIFQRNRVRRGSDRGSYASDVRRNRNRQCKANLAALVRKRPEHRGKEREHHCGGGSVAHEHGEQPDYEQEAHEHHLGIGSERSHEDAGELRVKADLGRAESQGETAEEEHHCRLREGRENRLVADEAADVRVGSECEGRLVGNGQEHEHDNHRGGTPGRDDLENPEHRREDEQGYDPYFHLRQNAVAEEKAIAEREVSYGHGLNREEPEESEKYQCNRKAHRVLEVEFLVTHLSYVYCFIVITIWQE